MARRALAKRLCFTACPVSLLQSRAVSYSIDRFTPYVGLYYDHEFDGRATGSVYGYKLKGVKITGGTTNAEIGFKYRPDVKNNALLIDVGIQGYTGKREGYSGVLKANWAF